MLDGRSTRQKRDVEPRRANPVSPKLRRSGRRARNLTRQHMTNAHSRTPCRLHRWHGENIQNFSWRLPIQNVLSAIHPAQSANRFCVQEQGLECDDMVKAHQRCWCVLIFSLVIHITRMSCALTLVEVCFSVLLLLFALVQYVPVDKKFSSRE